MVERVEVTSLVNARFIGPVGACRAVGRPSDRRGTPCSADRDRAGGANSRSAAATKPGANSNAPAQKYRESNHGPVGKTTFHHVLQPIAAWTAPGMSTKQVTAPG